MASIYMLPSWLLYVCSHHGFFIYAHIMPSLCMLTSWFLYVSSYHGFPMYAHIIAFRSTSSIFIQLSAYVSSKTADTDFESLSNGSWIELKGVIETKN